MTEIELMSDIAIPPGEYLEEVLEDARINQAELARRIGQSPQAINEIVKGEKPITPNIALQLEQILGISAQLWSNLETEFRLILAKKQQSKKIQKEETLVTEVTQKQKTELKISLL